MEPAKKISFSFSKFSKPSNIVTKPEERREIELIDCLEGQSIKLKNTIEHIKAPLVIPLRDNAKDLLDRVKQSKQLRTQKTEHTEKPDAELTLDELAAKELIKEAQIKDVSNITETKIHTLPVANDRSPPQNDQEPTLDDYENVPINDFGLAVLRGMGWTEAVGIGKQNQQVIAPIEPELRPKGLGLGANKIVNLKKDACPVDKDGKELTLIKGAFAKIIAGKHSGNYCEVMGLDDESGRIIVKTTIKSVVLSLNEFLVVPVTKEEYIKCAKVINNAEYEKHKAQINSTYSSAENKSLNRKDRYSSDEDNFKQTKNKLKHKYRSESPYSGDNSNKRDRSRSPSKDFKRKSRKHSASPESSDRKHTRKYDFNDRKDYKDKKYTTKSTDEKTKHKKKKSKKSKKYKKDSYSSDEEYRKKKSKKTRKYSSDSNSNSSADNKYSKSRTKYGSSGSYR